MKTQKILALTIAIFLAASIYLGLVNNANAQATTLSLNPQTTSGVDVGNTFAVTVHVADVANLWAWKIGLTWDPAMLAMVYPPGAQEGPFLKTGGSTIFTPATPNNATGVLTEIASALLTSTTVSGSGDLATMTFKVVGYGSSNINITGSILEDFNEAPIAHTDVNAIVTTLAPPPAHGPTAMFTPADGTYYTVGDTVSLDASSSLPGYDTANVAEVCPIATYSWKITGAMSMTFGGSTASFTTTIVGDLTVNLTVTAPDPHLPSAQGFSNTSTLIKTLHIQAVPVGATIDVYTDRGGQGPNATSDAYGPQELVNIYAKVTYNNAPVVGKSVAFEIQNAQNQAIAYVSGVTNANGVATAEFRLPWPDTNPESVFGNWAIVGTVDVSQVVVNDTVAFQFNYIIQIVSMQTLQTSNAPASSFARGTQMKVNVTLSNIRTVAVTTTLTITICDNCNVPVASFTVDITVPAQGQTAAAGTLNIPSYAFVGTATAYANALTQLPSQGGVPYCPEGNKQFVITV
jgi:hypothetical protein